MTKHTPGPWYVSTSPDYFSGGATVVRGRVPDSGLVIAVLTTVLEREANARLIALAPEMVRVLRLVNLYEPTCPRDHGNECIPCAARALLARLDVED